MTYFQSLSSKATPARLGEILLQKGELNSQNLNRALGLQKQRDAKLGDILIAHRFSSAAAVKQALNAQLHNDTVDISASKPDPMVLENIDPLVCIKLLALPWKKVGNTLVVVAADHTKFMEIAAAFPGRLKLVQARQNDVCRAIEGAFKTQLTKHAATSCPEPYSCRHLDIVPKRLFVAALIGLVIGLAAAVPSVSILVLLCWALLSNFATTALRLAALLSFAKTKRQPPRAGNVYNLAKHRKRPRVSVLIPLFKEDRVVGALLEAMDKLTYPKELLDIKILLEEEDRLTKEVLNRITLPHWISVLVVPVDTLQTKPRAMNYALPFCTGSIVGIYDAEDRPDPDQIDKIVDHFQDASSKVVAVQANLDFYNTNSNWLSRCFTIEYSAWFRVIMRGMQRLGLPLPLGGTSVFMRKNALVEVGGWDAHNVTEDADLGMRLARFGYRCEMVNSTTWEEANNVPVGWVKQRSRWIKGFIITWITHMRQPARSIQELGFAGFIGMQIVLLGTATAFILAPVFWLLWLGAFGFDWQFLSLMPDWFWRVTFAGLVLGELVMITISIVAVTLKKRFSLLPFILTMPLYWPIGTIAAYKALYEIVTNPFYWDKTTHGLD